MLYQFLPRLSDDEYTSLEKSIREHGIQVPIVVDENGSVIDGHHRKEIADRLGLPCPRNTARDLDETGKRTLACSLNLDRRHLNREQKREVIAKSLMADPQLSNRQHAERVGAHHTTVGTIRDSLESTGEISQSETRLSADGRERPATRPTPAADYVTDYVTDQADLDTALADAGFDTPDADSAPAHSASSPNGKQYTRPEPQTPRRSPLPDAFWRAAYDLTKVTERIGRLSEDDRFPQNAEKVAQANLGDLIRARDLLEQVIEQLNN